MSRLVRTPGSSIQPVTMLDVKVPSAKDLMPKTLSIWGHQPKRDDLNRALGLPLEGEEKKT